MTIRWTRTALRDLEALESYIAQDKPAAAAAVAALVIDGIEGLQRHPEMGRKGRIAGTRELVITPYVVAYRLRRTVVDVVAIIHGARKWPESL
ncbi:MAG: type II toxin-antitoxin system RelE/ParE family toxin [Bryobacteraceae bacterium]